jgi:drug/metabolite transporter (DMT)-like permease
MFARVGLPMVFVFLWSSAFVTGKIAVIYATPFAFLLLRFSIVALLFGGLMLAAKAWLAHQRRKPQTPAQDTPAQDTPAQDTPDNWRTLLATAIVGVMLHGFYLGSVFLALSLGIPAGLAALVVSMQPLLSSFLAIFLFAEALRRIQWAGIFLGFVGVAVVLMPTIDGGAGGDLSMAGLGVTFFGLAAITCGTLMQKKFGNHIGLMKGNFIQAAAAALFYLAITPLLEVPQFDWQTPFVLALSWQILAVSLGAYVIFMVLIKRDSMAATSSLLFLVPPTTAIMAALWFGEVLTPLSMGGFVLASAGVYMVTHYSSPATP